MLATDGTWRDAEDAPRDWRDLIELVSRASIMLLLMVGLLMLVRRLSGALDSPLAPAPLIATAAGLAAWGTAVRVQFGCRRVGWTTFAVLAMFAVGCSYPVSRIVDWPVWVATFVAVWLIPSKLRPAVARTAPPADQTLQELTRSRTADGVETIRGTVVAEFAANERTAIVHIAVCPPFERLPAVEAHRTAGPACEVKITQVLHQGVRLEVRLTRASTAAERVKLDFVAHDQP
jgi:hypothetical protein